MIQFLEGGTSETGGGSRVQVSGAANLPPRSGWSPPRREAEQRVPSRIQTRQRVVRPGGGVGLAVAAHQSEPLEFAEGVLNLEVDLEPEMLTQEFLRRAVDLGLGQRSLLAEQNPVR